MSSKQPRPPILHVHTSRFPHDPVEIFGNARGLERLINALIDAVDLGRGGAEVCTSDCESFAVRAACLEGDRRPEEWAHSGSPRWDVEDPAVARVLELTEENRRLKQVIASLRRERKAIRRVDYSAGDDPVEGGHLGST